MVRDDDRREQNFRVLKAMLEACGTKDFDTGLQWLTEDVYCDWPYRPIPEMPDVMEGRETIRDFFVAGQAEFAGLNYRLMEVFRLLDPDMLIAEYASDSYHLASGVPYRNQYLGIFRFRDGQISYWREYINPLAIQAVFDALKSTDGSVGA